MAWASLVRARWRVRSCVLDLQVRLQQCNLTVKKKKKTSLFGSTGSHCYVRLKGWHNCVVASILTLKEKPNALHVLNLCAYNN